MNDFQYFDKIERYLEGSLTAEERKAFEQATRQNPALAKELEDYRRLRTAVGKQPRNVSSEKIELKMDNPKILQQIKTAHQRARAEGLLLTDEDLWNYCTHRRADAEKIRQIEQRRQTDPLFQQQIEEGQALIGGIQNHLRKKKMVEAVRASLLGEGFFEKIYTEIEMENQQTATTDSPKITTKNIEIQNRGSLESAPPLPPPPFSPMQPSPPMPKITIQTPAVATPKITIQLPATPPPPAPEMKVEHGGKWTTRRVLAMAASFLVLIFAATFIYQKMQVVEAVADLKQEIQLGKSTFIGLLDNPEIRSQIPEAIRPNIEKEITAVIAAIEKDDTQTLLRKTETLRTIFPATDEWLAAEGMAYFLENRDRLDLAIEKFKKVSALTTTTPQQKNLKETAQWMTGLSYAKMGKPEESEKILEQLIDSGSETFKKPAQLLQKKLE